MERLSMSQPKLSAPSATTTMTEIVLCRNVPCKVPRLIVGLEPQQGALSFNAMSQGPSAGTLPDFGLADRSSRGRSLCWIAHEGEMLTMLSLPSPSDVSDRIVAKFHEFSRFPVGWDHSYSSGVTRLRG